MRLHAYITQALQPGAENLQFAQLPDVTFEDSEKLGKGLKQLEDFSDVLAQKNDPRLSEVRKAEQKWGRLELVEAGFKVIGERLVTPQCIVHLVVKLRISPPSSKNGAAVKEEKATPPLDDDEAFLIGNKVMDPIDEKRQLGAAHAPYWPGDREPSWWLVLGDEKSSRVVVPPLKITNIPVANPNSGKPDYRRYKMQFQAPGGVGLYTWKIYLVSDTFVGGEIVQPLVLKIDQPVAETADAQEDDISDPEEDSLAGQMALMRGGSVKKIGAEDDDSDDDESGTDDDKKPAESDSDSDSD